MELEEFKNYCNKKFCLRKTTISRLCEKDYKQEQCFEKFLKKQEKNVFIIDDKWSIVRENVELRDKFECRLLKVLPAEQKKELKQNGSFLLTILDPAHYIRRSFSNETKYDLDNVVLLNRYSHSCIDSNLSPINGKAIDLIEWNYWWELILGKDLKNKLDKKYKELINE